jgi:cytochrome P450
MARPFFSKSRISDFALFSRLTQTTLSLLSHRWSQNLPIDIQDLFQRFTLDVASELLFGVPLDTLSRPLTMPGNVKLGPKGCVPIEGKTEFDVFTEAFEDVAVVVTMRGVLGDAWPLLELWEDRTDEGIDKIVEWIDPIVKRVVEEAEVRRREEGIGKEGSVKREETVFLNYLASETDGEFSLSLTLIEGCEIVIMDCRRRTYPI